MNKRNIDIIICSNILNWIPPNLNISSDTLKLTYNDQSPDKNVSLELPHFIKSLNCHFPNRIKDLLEIAGYVYAADRLIKRGNPQSVEYQSWSRNLEFHITVRDYKFWNQKSFNSLLDEALSFISGDNSLSFNFYPGGTDIGQKSLFDNESIKLEKKENSTVVLFSGGLDSLAGVLEILETTNKNLILISHRSSNPGITKLQKALSAKLMKDYSNRIQYYPFYCSLTGERAVEETQRSRIFLYTSIAFSLSKLASSNEINVFENGITSINFYKRQDLINARASRTTHPRSLHFLELLFTKIAVNNFKINHPYLFNTKTDILNKILKFNKESYINSTLTCTKTFLRFTHNSQASHCGCCSQCIDRRLAAYASNLEEFDAIYDVDIAKDQIIDSEAKMHLFDYIHLVSEFNQSTEFSFPFEYTDILTDLVPYITGENDSDKINKIFSLIKIHTQQIQNAIKRIMIQDDPLLPKKENTLINYVGDRIYLKAPTERMIEEIESILKKAIPEAFKRSKPKNENVLNDLINAVLMPYLKDYEREYPGIRFSTTTMVPDHSIIDSEIIIESKFLKPNKSISAITNEIGADIIKYPQEKCKLFVIYDPFRKITNDDKFSKDFEKNPNTQISVIR